MKIHTQNIRWFCRRDAGSTLALTFITIMAVWLMAVPARAQTATNAPSVLGGLEEIGQAIEGINLSSLTNYSFDPYVTLAPKAPAGNRVGGGLLAVYNVNDYVGAGLGVDYLGQFSLVSCDATLKLPTHPLSWTGWSWATNLVVTPFVLGGIGTPLGGASGSGAAAVEDLGGYVEYGHLWGGRFDAGACNGQWNNAGAYGVKRYHLFVGWTYRF